MQKIKPIQLLLFLIVNILACTAAAQSKNIDNPTKLTTNTIEGLSNPDGEEPIYYTLEVTEGTLKITGEVTSGYGGCQLTFSFLTPSHNEISNNDFWGDQQKKITSKEFNFAQPQKVILKIAFNGTATKASFLFEGAININGSSSYAPVAIASPTIPASNDDNKYVDKLIPGLKTFTKATLKQLTIDGSKIGLYVLEKNIESKTINGPVSNSIVQTYFIQLPNTNDEKVYGFMHNKFSPKFNEKGWQYVQDKPSLADKIKNKVKGYFYPAFTSDDQRLKVWWNIINDYNKQD